MKRLLTLTVLLAVKLASAQTNTFPANGNVGIGTLNPQYGLQIQKTSSQPAVMIGGGHSGSPRLQVYGLDADPNAWMGLGADMNGGPYEHSVYFPTAPANYMGRLTFGDYDGTNYNVRMSILKNGNVGIGTTTPAVSLHVNGKGRLENNLKVFGGDEAWAEGISIIKPNGWSGVRIARNDPSTGNFEGNWAIGYNAYSGNDFSISNNFNNSQNDYIFHISASTRNIGIGTATPNEKLSVNGKIRAQEIKVENTNWPDYVFRKDYQLPSLAETEKHIMERGHLPGIPSAEEVHANGISIGEMNAKLLQKVEELTLHLIEQGKEIKELKQINVELKTEIDKLKINH